ncbi:hypothetical protein ACIA58_29710 [Kribbella sp. NPDC051586]|uniref:hypothetical protein n=1 Tax=Kribbella sp. NPDC051586 TaxID=3364118 RepID=UPI0037872B05
MEYAEFEAARRRIIHAWGNEISDPGQLAAAVADLREQATSLTSGSDRALRYLAAMDELVAEASETESEYVRRASDVMMRSSAPEGTPAEQRARAEAGMAEIARIAEEAPTAGERDAVLEMNEPLAVIAASDTDRGVDDRAARFAVDPAMAPAGRIGAPKAAPGSRSTTAASSTGPKAPDRDL